MLSDAVPDSLIRPDESGLLTSVIAMTGGTESSFLQRIRAAWSVGASSSETDASSVPPPQADMTTQATACAAQASFLNLKFIPNAPSIGRDFPPTIKKRRSRHKPDIRKGNPHRCQGGNGLDDL
jgi:hypothetical protein